MMEPKSHLLPVYDGVARRKPREILRPDSRRNVIASKFFFRTQRNRSQSICGTHLLGCTNIFTNCPFCHLGRWPRGKEHVSLRQTKAQIGRPPTHHPLTKLTRLVLVAFSRDIGATLLGWLLPLLELPLRLHQISGRPNIHVPSEGWPASEKDWFSIVGHFKWNQNK